MIALVIALILKELPPQRLAPGACAMALWDQASRTRVAMVIRAEKAPAELRLKIDEVETSLALVPDSAAGEAMLGFAPEAQFQGLGLSATYKLEMAGSPNGKGAAVRGGVLSVRIEGGEERVMPVAGLIGCE
jgi:hypothetical protein